MDYLQDSDEDYYEDEKCVNSQNDYSSNTEENCSDSIFELNELKKDNENNSGNYSGGILIRIIIKIIIIKTKLNKKRRI